VILLVLLLMGTLILLGPSLMMAMAQLTVGRYEPMMVVLNDDDQEGGR
jgi:hypothetical protein